MSFANCGIHWLSQLNVWWMRLGIQHQRSYQAPRKRRARGKGWTGPSTPALLGILALLLPRLAHAAGVSSKLLPYCAVTHRKIAAREVSRAAIEEAIHIRAVFSIVNRIANSLDFVIPAAKSMLARAQQVRMHRAG